MEKFDKWIRENAGELFIAAIFLFWLFNLAQGNVTTDPEVWAR